MAKSRSFVQLAPVQDRAAARRIRARMEAPANDRLELELALLRRGLDERLAGSQRCSGCHRTPLVGERVYDYPAGEVACELCQQRRREPPLGTHTVHGPEFGHTMRITDQRAAA